MPTTRSGSSYGLTAPCNNCPFRNDAQRVVLRKGRVRDIERALVRGEFHCHKTAPGPNPMHCAGALILLEKLERPSQMMRISERIGLYDRTKLVMDAPVFDSFKAMIKLSE